MSRREDVDVDVDVDGCSGGNPITEAGQGVKKNTFPYIR